MGLKERLILYIDYLGIAKSEFERTAGLANGFVDKSGDNTRYSSLDKISKSFPNLNLSWLRTGQGEMQLNNPSIKEDNSNYNIQDKNENDLISENNKSLDILAKAIDKLADSEKNNSENVKELIEQGKQQTQNMTKLIDYLLQNGIKTPELSKKGASESEDMQKDSGPYKSAAG